MKRLNFSGNFACFCMLAVLGLALSGNAQSPDSVADAGKPLEQVDHGHLGEITAWSASGNLILTCGADSRILIRNLQDGKLLLRYDFPSDGHILGATFSPGAHKIAVVFRATGSDEIRLKIFYTTTGKEILNQTIDNVWRWNDEVPPHAVLNYDKNTVYGALTTRGYTYGLAFGFHENGTRAELPTEFLEARATNGFSEESLRKRFPFEDLRYHHAAGALLRNLSPQEYRQLTAPVVRWTENTAEELLSPDRKCVARLHPNGILDVWSTETGESLFVLRTDLRYAGAPFQDLVDEWESFAFSPSGRYLFLVAVQRVDIFKVGKRGAFTTIQLPAPPLQLPNRMGDSPGKITRQICAWKCVSADEITLYIDEGTRYLRQIYSLPDGKLLSEETVSEYPEDIPADAREALPGSRNTTCTLIYPHQIVHEQAGKTLFRVYHFSKDDYLKIDTNGHAAGSARGLSRTNDF